MIRTNLLLSLSLGRRTLSILLAMENGGADIVELGVDPIVDGPVIQETNTVCSYALSNNFILIIVTDRFQEWYRLCCGPWAG